MPHTAVSAVAMAEDTHSTIQMLSREPLCLPALTALPTGLLDALSHLAETLTSDTSTEDLAGHSTVCFSLHQIMAHKNSALAGTQVV